MTMTTTATTTMMMAVAAAIPSHLNEILNGLSILRIAFAFGVLMITSVRHGIAFALVRTFSII